MRLGTALRFRTPRCGAGSLSAPLPPLRPAWSGPVLYAFRKVHALRLRYSALQIVFSLSTS